MDLVMLIFLDARFTRNKMTRESAIIDLTIIFRYTLGLIFLDIIFIVVNDIHDWICVKFLFFLVAKFFHVHFEEKLGAFLIVGFEAYISVVHMYNVFANAQTKLLGRLARLPRINLVLVIRRTLRWQEFKQFGLIFLSDADSRIVDLYM